MALRMAAPWKDPKTGVWYLRQRTPRELAVELRGKTIRLPIGDHFNADVTVGEVVKVSLRTKEDQVAKHRHALADAALRAFWAKARTASVLHVPRDVADAVETDASAAPAIEDVTVTDQHIGRVISVEEFTPAFQGVIGLPSPERESLMAAYRAAVMSLPEDYGLFRLKRRLSERVETSGSDEEPSAHHEIRAKPGPGRGIVMTVSDLWVSFQSYQSDKLAQNTVHRYRASVAALTSYFPTRDVRTLTSDDVYAWAVHRRDVDNIHPKTINSNDLVAISSLFKWAMKREGGRLLTHNPAKGERLDVPRKTGQRERTFRDAEIETILRAALAVVPKQGRNCNADAKRWCPWLAAYSGARISELTALTAEDIRQEQGVHIMHFRETKGSFERSVPLHEHLIALGFLTFVRQIGSGPLFYVPLRHKHGARTLPHEIRSRKVADWVRATAKLDMRVDPNHGWRHTFKSRALGRMDERIRDAIVGHQPGSVARRYETPSVIQMADALKMFARYSL